MRTRQEDFAVAAAMKVVIEGLLGDLENDLAYAGTLEVVTFELAIDVANAISQLSINLGTYERLVKGIKQQPILGSLALDGLVLRKRFSCCEDKAKRLNVIAHEILAETVN